MDLFEYQARDLLAAHGVPVPPGMVARTPEEARAAAVRLGGGPVVVKAQVKTGGRGKAGGVRLARDPDEAHENARAILGMDIKGHRVHRVLVVAASEIAAEYYVSFLVDRASQSLLAIASAQGGVEIEQLAAERPEAIARQAVDPESGLTEAAAGDLATAAGLPATVVPVLLALWDAFTAQDALLVEVNPLALDASGQLLALDGKVTLDGNASFRHPERSESTGRADGSVSAAAIVPDGDDLEARARARGLNYVRLDGAVGVIGNGAGLVMSTLDVVALAGDRLAGEQPLASRHASGPIRPANFLDIGGGASAQVMADGLEIILSDPQVRSVLVNVFGGITACDAVADGIVAAFGLLAARGEPVQRPVVVRLDGNSAARGRQILAAAGLPGTEVADTMDDAARAAVLHAAAPHTAVQHTAPQHTAVQQAMRAEA